MSHTQPNNSVSVRAAVGHTECLCPKTITHITSSLSISTHRAACSLLWITRCWAPTAQITKSCCVPSVSAPRLYQHCLRGAVHVLGSVHSREAATAPHTSRHISNSVLTAQQSKPPLLHSLLRASLLYPSLSNHQDGQVRGNEGEGELPSPVGAAPDVDLEAPWL